MERIKPGKGELIAAIRLLREAALRNSKYSDTVCTDALYKVAPLMGEVTLRNSCTFPSYLYAALVSAKIQLLR